MTLQEILGIAGSGGFLAVVGWAAKLSNRVTALEAHREDLTTLINTRFDDVDRRLARIERVMNGKLGDHD